MGIYNALMDIGNDGVCVRDVVMDVGNKCVGVCDILVNIGNHSLGVHNIVADVRNDYKCVNSKFGLEMGNQHRSPRSDGTHIEDEKDPVEVQPPGCDRLFIVLRVEKSRDRISFAPLDDIPLDLSHSPAIASLVSELPKVHIPGSTHVVNSPIASNTD